MGITIPWKLPSDILVGLGDALSRVLHLEGATRVYGLFLQVLVGIPEHGLTFHRDCGVSIRRCAARVALLG